MNFISIISKNEIFLGLSSTYEFANEIAKIL